MTEFLKNDPIALRYCLLYEFLQGKTIEDSFSNFCAAVGEDFFSKEEIYSRFLQFNRGVFQVGVKPVTDIRNILCNNKKALRVCVMYEWLSSKQSTVSAKYENFCKVIGKYSIMYQDFHFWFHRFVNGEFDLNYKDEKIYKLTDMPLDIMKIIVDYLDIFDRSSLKKTSRSLQTFIEDQKLFHHTLNLSLSHFCIRFIINNPDHIYYTGENRCCKSTKNGARLIQDVPFWKKGLLDFKSIIKNPKLYLDTLKIASDLYYKPFRFHQNLPLEDVIVDELYNSLKFTHYLNVKTLRFKGHFWHLLLTVLSCLKPGYLTTINFDIDSYEPREDVMRELVETEQWKQAKYLEMKFPLFVCPLRHLYHFKEFSVIYKELSVMDLREMKKILFNSPDFEKCTIGQNSLDMDSIRHEFGEAIQGKPNTYHYPIRNSSEYFEIELDRWEIEITRKKK